MKARHLFSGAALAVAIVLTVIGMFTGAAVLLGLATAVEIIASAVNGKKTNA